MSTDTQKAINSHLTRLGFKNQVETTLIFTQLYAKIALLQYKSGDFIDSVKLELAGIDFLRAEHRKTSDDAMQKTINNLIDHSENRLNKILEASGKFIEIEFLASEAMNDVFNILNELDLEVISHTADSVTVKWINIPSFKALNEAFIFRWGFTMERA